MGKICFMENHHSAIAIRAVIWSFCIKVEIIFHALFLFCWSWRVRSCILSWINGTMSESLGEWVLRTCFDLCLRDLFLSNDSFYIVVSWSRCSMWSTIIKSIKSLKFQLVLSVKHFCSFKFTWQHYRVSFINLIIFPSHWSVFFKTWYWYILMNNSISFAMFDESSLRFVSSWSSLWVWIPKNESTIILSILKLLVSSSTFIIIHSLKLILLLYNVVHLKNLVMGLCLT